MKKVILRESKAPYTLAIDDETMAQEPVILERGGRPVAVIIPIVEYEAFRAWREALVEPWPEEPPPTPRVTGKPWPPWSASAPCSPM